MEGLDGAVIRDVMIFNSVNKDIPDETDATEWTLTARVYFDVVSADETGTLSLTRAGTTESAKIPVRLSAKALNDPQDVSIVVPV